MHSCKPKESFHSGPQREESNGNSKKLKIQNWLDQIDLVEKKNNQAVYQSFF